MIQSNSDLMKNVYHYLNAENSIKAEADNLSHHIKLHRDNWGFTLWDGNDVQLKRNDIIRQNDNLLVEYLEDIVNNTNKSPTPIKMESLENVVLTQGMSESIDRDIGASSTALDYCSLGTSSTAEAESQTDLQTEFTDTAYARLQFSTAGQRQRVNQTMRLGVLWNDTNFDSVPVTIREAGVHWHLSDASKCHARVVSSDFSMSAGNLFVVQINELQANGTV